MFSSCGAGSFGGAQEVEAWLVFPFFFSLKTIF